MSVDGQYEIAWGIAQGLEDYRNSFTGGYQNEEAGTFSSCGKS